LQKLLAGKMIRDMKTYEILSFHPGRQHNLEQARQIAKTFKNFRHITGLYFSNTQVKRFKKISSKIGSILQKRSFELNGEIVDTNPWPEIKILLRKHFGEKLWYNSYVNRNREFQTWILRKYVAPRICIGYDTCSWKIFEKWKNKSFLVLDLSIAIPQYKLTLAKTNGISIDALNKLTNDDQAVYNIYSRELELADLILCGSDFVRQSCLSEGIDSRKLFLLPYGIDLNKFYNPDIQPESKHLRVVFIGSVTFRKGADIVLKSWEKIRGEFPSAELHFYGSIEMPISQSIEGVFFHGFVPQEYLIQELKKAHISVLPSFFEGSSLAIYQSMAMGLSTITTQNTGSVIKDGRNGFIINYGSENELTEKLRLLLRDGDLRKQLAFNASEDVKKYTWDDYGRKLQQLLTDILENKI
jgi:glycosyltransferase involved in cell wall biosynthesis